MSLWAAGFHSRCSIFITTQNNDKQVETVCVCVFEILGHLMVLVEWSGADGTFSKWQK